MTVFGKKIEEVDLSVWLALLLALLFFLHDDSTPIGRVFNRVTDFFKNIWDGFFSFLDTLFSVPEASIEVYGNPPLYPWIQYPNSIVKDIVSKQGRNGGAYGSYWKEHPIKGVHDKHF